MKKAALIIITEIDRIDDKIRALQKEKELQHLKLKRLKADIEKEHSHIIGRFARCTNGKGQEFNARCNAVLCTDDLSIKPLFRNNGIKCFVDTYEWI